MLQEACQPPLRLLPGLCTVVGGLGDPLGQVSLITSPRLQRAREALRDADEAASDREGETS